MVKRAIAERVALANKPRLAFEFGALKTFKNEFADENRSEFGHVEPSRFSVCSHVAMWQAIQRLQLHWLLLPTPVSFRVPPIHIGQAAQEA